MRFLNERDEVTRSALSRLFFLAHASEMLIVFLFVFMMTHTLNY